MPSSLVKVLLAAAAVLAVLFFFGVLDWGYWRSWGRSQVAVASSQVGSAIGGTPVSPAAANAHAATCRGNLRRIESAKRQAAEKSGVTRADIPWSEVVPFLGGKRPSCPSGGSYILGPSTTLPKCSISNNRTSANADDHILDQF